MSLWSYHDGMVGSIWVPNGLPISVMSLESCWWNTSGKRDEQWIMKTKKYHGHVQVSQTLEHIIDTVIQFYSLGELARKCNFFVILDRQSEKINKRVVVTKH